MEKLIEKLSQLKKDGKIETVEKIAIIKSYEKAIKELEKFQELYSSIIEPIEIEVNVKR